MNESENESIIQAPEIRVWNKPERYTRFEFKDKKHPLAGRYFMRGGICWPRPVLKMGTTSAEGCCVVCGHFLDKGWVVCFEEKPFVCIDHILRDDGGVQFEGVSTFFNETWSKYFLDTWYFRQSLMTSKSFRLQVARSEMIVPKPHFVEALWEDEAYADGVLWSVISTGKLKYRQGGLIHDALQKYQMRPVGVMLEPRPPVIHALICALVGMERYPWRPRNRT